MDHWGYPHELGYHREFGKGLRRHEHTERRAHRTSWLASALTLARSSCACTGCFRDARNHISTIRLDGSAKITRNHPSEKVSAGRR